MPSRKTTEVVRAITKCLLKGYQLGDGDEWHEVGGILGTQLRRGYLTLEHPLLEAPNLRLPYFATLRFGKPELIPEQKRGAKAAE